FRAHGFFHAALHLENLLPRLYQSFFEPAALIADLALANGPDGDRFARLAQHEHFPAGNAGRNRDSSENSLSSSRQLWHGASLIAINRFGNPILSRASFE